MPRIRRSSRAARPRGETCERRFTNDATGISSVWEETAGRLFGSLGAGEDTPVEAFCDSPDFVTGEERDDALACIIHEHFCPIADSQLGPACRRAGSPLGRSTSCSRRPSFLTAPRARLASRLRTFATNRHEQCGLARLALLCADGGWPTHCLKPRWLRRRPEAAGRRSAARGAGNLVRAAERS